MSQPTPNPHTQRSVAGMIGSMIVVVICVVGWVGFRSFISDPPSPPPRVVDWTVSVEMGTAAKELALYAPLELPAGWSAKDARYVPGEFPRWQIALRTDNVRTISIVEATVPARTLVDEVNEDAEQGDDVTINGVVWQSWRFPRGDYGISLITKAPSGGSEAVLLHGSGSPNQTHDLAASLSPRNIASARSTPTTLSTPSASSTPTAP